MSNKNKIHRGETGKKEDGWKKKGVETIKAEKSKEVWVHKSRIGRRRWEEESKHRIR